MASSSSPPPFSGCSRVAFSSLIVILSVFSSLVLMSIVGNQSTPAHGRVLLVGDADGFLPPRGAHMPLKYLIQSVREGHCNPLESCTRSRRAPYYITDQGIRVKSIVTVGGTGQDDFTSISDAVESAPSGSRAEEDGYHAMYVRGGVYEEHVSIPYDRKHILMFGDGIGRTIITGNRSHHSGFPTYFSATFAVAGEGFLADCNIYSRKPAVGGETVVTAQGRSTSEDPSSFVFQNCTVKPAADLAESLGSGIKIKNYLGRPWQEYSRVVFMESYIGNHIDPKGWMEYSKTGRLDKLYYGEYDNWGPGSNTSRRVHWKGYHVMNFEEALNFTLYKVTGTSWLRKIDVPYDDD
ncbi:hypothetical protein SAY87_009880 [Trapa incisa]|uniref:Pectinesterase catalytic domain-containing protein n=1 Tax=Trapa incisa TaxID=236973 RepID=A0AAN7PYR9_9MYRT|nr:hypothetical protein SAY87_009880 [Trapa incisa]